MRTDPGAPPGAGLACGRSIGSNTAQWLRLAHLVGCGPILRLYCAIRPVPPLGPAPEHRPPSPYPPHPAHPTGTSWVPATELVHEATTVLRDLVDNRSDRRDEPLSHLTEYVIRPLVVVLRELLEDPGGELFVVGPSDVGFEVSPQRRLTGRVVILDATEVQRRPAVAQPVVADSARRFAGYFEALAQRFARVGLGDAGPAVTNVLATELRFLRTETAGIVGRSHPWARFVHTVDAGQDRALRSVLRAVADAGRRRRADASLPAPLVAVDPALAGSRGLHRFARDVSDAGGELVTGPVGADRGALLAEFTPADGGMVQVAAATGQRARIATFETWPRSRQPPGVRAVPALSHTRSLEELQLAELRIHRPARDYVVMLSGRESAELVERLVARSQDAAARTAEAALGAVRRERGTDSVDDRTTVALVRHLITRKQFIKGSRSNYPTSQAEIDMLGRVRDGHPIPCIMMGFPFKRCENGLKVLGRLPDLAELGALVRLRELRDAIRRVYPPGIRLTVLTDGRHFQPRSASMIEPYQRKLAEYCQLVGCDDFIRFVDVDEHARTTLGIEAGQHERLVEHHRRLLWGGFAGLDVTCDPLAVIRRAGAIYHGLEEAPAEPALPRSIFPELFMSIAFSVPVSAPDGVDRMAWSKAVFDDLYDVGPGVAAEVLAARQAVLRRSWDATIRYVSTLRADAELGYDRLFADSVWMKAGAPRPGTCGFCFLGGSGLLPWHGTGAIGARGEVSTDFAISLFDQAFVQVFSPLLGEEQPLMMVPVTATYVEGDRYGASLDRAFVERVRLRRR